MDLGLKARAHTSEPPSFGMGWYAKNPICYMDFVVDEGEQLRSVFLGQSLDLETGWVEP